MRIGSVGQQNLRRMMFFVVALGGCSEPSRTSPFGPNGDAGPEGSFDGSVPQGGEPGDVDGDGVPDGTDNCRKLTNPDQVDSDGDGWGDRCDNCAIVANASQETVKCESGAIGQGDQDGDKAVDAKDNCALVANFDQLNGDGDLFGDACDNCPMVENDNQANADDDRLGDACDQDLSNEELCAEGSTNAKPLKPNLYFLFDTSGSMSDSDIDNLNNAVEKVSLGPDGRSSTPDDLVNDFNVGMSTYPNGGGACFLQPRERLDLRDNNTSQALIRVLPTGSEGGTPTAAALGGVIQRQLFVLEGESPSSRPAAIVLMTDGEPNDCGGQSDTVKQAARAATLGVPVYVIAYKLKGDGLKQATEVALAGSVSGRPQRPLEASDAAGIEAAFNAIRSQVVSCTFPFEAQGDANYERVEVVLHVNSTSTKLSEGNNGYRLDPAARTGELTGSACDTFKAHSEDGSASVELRVACKPKCEPMVEVCDFRDNNCDGNADEGCSSTPPEVCNELDDDGDGQVDEGCPVRPI